MVKRVLRTVLVSILLACFTSCSIPPSYSRQEIVTVIKKICQEEFGIKVGVWTAGDTVWIYAPFEKVMDKEGQLDAKVSDDIRRINLSLMRVFLNMDHLPKFYCFVISDIKNMGIDWYQVAFIPDMIKFYAQLISLNETAERTFTLNMQNLQALGDTEGRHIQKYDININEFVALLIRQNIAKKFLYTEEKNNYEVRELKAAPLGNKLVITINIKTVGQKPGLALPLDVAEKSARNILSIYSEFHNISVVKIVDNFQKEIKEFTVKSNTAKEFSSPGFVKKQTLRRLLDGSFEVLLGHQYYLQKNLEAAQEHYLKASRINPRDATAYMGVGKIYFSSGKYKQALEFFKKAEELIPETPEAINNIAVTYFSLGDYARALQYFEALKNKNPNEPGIDYRIGLTYSSLGKYRKAVENYEKALKATPDRPEIYYDLGIAHYALANYGRAIDNYQKALSLDPKLNQVYFALGYAYFSINKYEESAVYFEKFLKSSPGNSEASEAYLALAETYRHLGRIDEAKENFQRAEEILKNKRDGSRSRDNLEPDIKSQVPQPQATQTPK